MPAGLPTLLRPGRAHSVAAGSAGPANAQTASGVCNTPLCKTSDSFFSNTLSVFAQKIGPGAESRRRERRFHWAFAPGPFWKTAGTRPATCFSDFRPRHQPACGNFPGLAGAAVDARDFLPDVKVTPASRRRNNLSKGRRPGPERAYEILVPGDDMLVGP